MIIDNQITKWVKDAIKKGYTDEEIIFFLSQNNYKSQEIEKVLAVFYSLKNTEIFGSKTRKQIQKVSDYKTKNKKGFLAKIIGKKETKAEQKIVSVPPEIKEIAGLISQVKKEVAKVVVGQEKVINGFICAMLCDGHVLLEGVPGIAKTLIVKTLAKASGCDSKRIQFTVDLLPSDILGITTYTPEKGFETIKGPIFANFIIGDEINRSPPKTQSALIEAMQEKQVTIGKETFKLPLPFFVMANNNPLETSGVYSLPEAQIDRFLFKLLIDYPKNEEEKKVMGANITLKKFEDFNINSVLSPEIILYMQKITKEIYTDEKIRNYILRIIEKTRKKDFENGKYIDWGGSPRASIGLFIASKAWALMNGRNYVLPKDVQDIAHYVLRHRIILNYKARAERIDSDKIIDEILEMVSV